MTIELECGRIVTDDLKYDEDPACVLVTGLRSDILKAARRIGYLEAMLAGLAGRLGITREDVERLVEQPEPEPEGE